MSIVQLDTENADRNLTSLVTVLTHTPSVSDNVLCQGYVALGDGTKNLDGTGGQFELVVTVGGQTVQPSPQIMTFGTEVRSSVWTTVFPVPANNEVILRVLSPNAADTDVDVTAYLFDVAAGATEAWGHVVESTGSITAEQILRALFARAAGNRSGGGTASLTWFRPDGTTEAIKFDDTDVDGNTSNITVDLSA